jgi:hypothetical protein
MHCPVSLKYFFYITLHKFEWRHDIQQNDLQTNGTEQNDSKLNDTEQNDSK